LVYPSCVGVLSVIAYFSIVFCFPFGIPFLFWCTYCYIATENPPYTHPERWITQTVQEAPTVLPYKGRFLIFFSGNSTGPKYGIGVCIADHPYNGPFRKLKKNPLIQQNGSGHCSITKDAKGYVVAFHMGGNRNTHLGRITFGDDDTPLITSF